jgi:hypothetical protein
MMVATFIVHIVHIDEKRKNGIDDRVPERILLPSAFPLPFFLLTPPSFPLAVLNHPPNQLDRNTLSPSPIHHRI